MYLYLYIYLYIYISLYIHLSLSLALSLSLITESGSRVMKCNQMFCDVGGAQEVGCIGDPVLCDHVAVALERKGSELGRAYTNVPIISLAIYGEWRKR